MSSLDEFFKHTTDRLERNPNLILEVEYDRMIEFFTVLYRQGKKDLCKKLILIAIDKHGPKVLENFSESMLAFFDENGKMAVTETTVDDCVEITIDEFKTLDSPRYVGRTVGSETHYHSIWEYNGIYSKVLVTKEKGDV
jgi:hypothetical protein